MAFCQFEGAGLTESSAKEACDNNLRNMSFVLAIFR